MKRFRRSTAYVLVVSLLVCLFGGSVAASAQEVSAIDPAVFANPDMQYRPGVRWWWPGNAASTEDLIKQVDYLADNGFGAVEIVAFSAGFLSKPEGKTQGSIYLGLDDYDRASILSYDTPAYYDKLKAVVEHANRRGIIVDLNAGSGYLGNDDSVAIEDSQSNMALGRYTRTFGSFEIGNMHVLSVPPAEISPLYAVKINGVDMGRWDAAHTHLNGVVVARKTADGDALTVNNQTVNLTTNTVEKSYASQYVLDLAGATVVDATDITSGYFSFTPLAPGDYEVIALYSAPSGSIGLNALVEGPKGRSYVVDHLNSEAIKNYINGWLGDTKLSDIVNTCDIRAVFNDSYEFYTDSFYNDVVYKMAKDQSLLGYDIRKFIPSVYHMFNESFVLGTLDTSRIPGLNVSAGFSAGGRPLLTSPLSADEKARVTYDYNRLIDQAFQQGLKSYSDTLKAHNGIVYRQQAYNPPLDTLKASKFVDIPETEGESEYSLKRITSGAHLYGKNLITSEVYTLGNTPFNVLPQKIKNGYDLMATSGVTNFFYHGLSATYYGTEQQKASGFFGEEGWRAWPTIGVEMADTEAVSPYYKSMNAYASRANYVMQAGRQSSDIAVYMPLFGSVSENSTVKTLNTNGYVWDAINDDCIQTELRYTGGKLTTAAGMTYTALIVDKQTLPVATMSALKALAAQGAPILFYGALPDKQPGYAGGGYAALDAQVATLATDIAATGRVAHIPTVTPSNGNSAALAAALAAVCTPPVTYAPNESVRFNRRSLTTGGELAYIRNTSATVPTDVTLKVSPGLTNCYWLDQMTGKIFAAARNSANEFAVRLNAGGAVILLCEPSSAAMATRALSQGLPLSIDTPVATDTQTLTDFSLTVTADNIGTHIPGAVTTVTYQNALGNWAVDGFQNGALKYVSSPGVYTTTFTVSDLSQYSSRRMLLDLGTVNYAATVRVNGANVGQLFSAPFRIDITNALKAGVNTLQVEVQTLKHNRRIGLRRAYAVDGIQKYLTYNSHVGATAAPVSSGLIGPVVLSTASGGGFGRVSSIKMDSAVVVSLKKGRTLQLGFATTPAAQNKNAFEWSSSTPAIATVDQKGLVTGVKAGIALIMVKALDGSGKTGMVTVAIVS